MEAPTCSAARSATHPTPAAAEGYQPLVSPVVGVPPEVTDLHLALMPAGLRVYLPLVSREGQDTPLPNDTIYLPLLLRDWQ